MSILLLSFFFFNDTATTEIYTLSLHDALPISARVASIMENTNLSKQQQVSEIMRQMLTQAQTAGQYLSLSKHRSEERFSRNAETDLVCRLLLEKKKIDCCVYGTLFFVV